MRILREETAAALVDVQERIVPAMADAHKLLRGTVQLIKGLNILEVPIVAVRQYPRGLGDLMPQVKEALGGAEISDKLTFSAWDTEEIAERIKSTGAKNILVFGIEAHVCVLQTVVDLAAEGYQAVLVEDCIASRREEDRQTAIIRARKEGAVITSSESILFELLRKAGSDRFRQISALVK